MRKHNEWTQFNEFYLHTFDEKRTPVGRLLPLDFNSTSGIFRLENEDYDLDFGRDYLLICRSEKNKIEIVLQSKIIKFDKLQMTILYLKCLEQNETDQKQEHYEYYILPGSGIVPTIWGQHPWFISEKIFGFIIGIHAKGLKIRLQLDRLSVMPGMIVNFHLSFPGTKARSFRFKILRGYTSEQDFIVEIGIVGELDEFASFLGRGIAISYPNYSPEKFKSAGLVLPALRWACHVELATDESAIRQCLELRKVAYSAKHTSRFNGEESVDVFKDEFDDHSILILIKLGNKPIGTGRIIFNNGESSNSEIAQLTDVSGFMSEGGFVESSRFATHPDYRGRDVFLLMLYLTFKLSFLAGYRYLLIDCEDHLLPVYRKMGGKDLGVRFSHPLEGVTLNLVRFDLQGLVAGKGVGLFTWIVVVCPLLKHLAEVGLIQVNPIRRILILGGSAVSEIYRRFL